MHKSTCLLLLILWLTNCLQPKPVMHGKRISIAKGNISFIIPDSLTYGKPILWPADFSSGEYGEADASYYNQDSTMSVFAYVTAYPNTLQNSRPWRHIADEKAQRETLLAKTHGLAAIEKYQADSLSRTIVIDYHFLNRQEKGWRGQASYEKSLTIYGRHRTIEFQLSGPDNSASRQKFDALQASIQVKPAYLLATVAPR